MNSKPICLIIGAGDYIGAAIARRFAIGGFHIVMGRRHVKKLAPVIAEIETAGGSAQGFTWDARKEETATDALSRLGPTSTVLHIRPETVFPPPSSLGGSSVKEPTSYVLKVSARTSGCWCLLAT